MTGFIDITVNGKRRSLDLDASAEDLVQLLGLAEESVTLQINGSAVPRSMYPERQLNAGDRIDIIHTVSDD